MGFQPVSPLLEEWVTERLEGADDEPPTLKRCSGCHGHHTGYKPMLHPPRPRISKHVRQ